jgi:hypothetical protein
MTGGLLGAVFGALFGGGRNVVRDTAEVFRVNAEAEAARTAAFQNAALGQFATEFAHARQGGFDRFIDGLNRVPRPAMALGVLFLLGSAMVDPIWFGSRMAGLALVPEPLWWLLGAIVSFYFGARHQSKTRDFQQSAAATAIATAALAARGPREPTIGLGDTSQGPDDDAADFVHGTAAPTGGSNPALDDWRTGR